MRLHHRQGLAESELCQLRASRAELKDFCGELTVTSTISLPEINHNLAAEEEEETAESLT